MIIEIEPSDQNRDIIFVNLGADTWYKAQKIGGKEGYCDIVRIVGASNGSTTFKQWGLDHDGVIKLYAPYIRKRQF